LFIKLCFCEKKTKILNLYFLASWLSFNNNSFYGSQEDMAAKKERKKHMHFTLNAKLELAYEK